MLFLLSSSCASCQLSVVTPSFLKCEAPTVPHPRNTPLKQSSHLPLWKSVPDPTSLCGRNRYAGLFPEAGLCHITRDQQGAVQVILGTGREKKPTVSLCFPPPPTPCPLRWSKSVPPTPTPHCSLKGLVINPGFAERARDACGSMHRVYLRII